MPASAGPEPADGRHRVGYLGPEGTFTEEALLASARPGTVEPVGLLSIDDTFAALRRGEVEWAIAPIENSLDGSVTVTLDLLAEDEAQVEIVGEALLRVRHSLIAAHDVALEQLDTVLTHPQVPGQCRRFLRDVLPGAQILPAASTAEAVRIVVEQARPGQAAIGTDLAAEIYGGTVLREGIQDREDNETRFVWLARKGDGGRAAPPLDGGGPHKTSLVFWGSGAQAPGWLVRCLDEFASRDINLTRIESRPRRERLGSYMFFADLLGDAAEEPVAAAIAGMGTACEEVRVLGSYPLAVPPGEERGGGRAAAARVPRDAGRPATLRP
jgi:prephenate dehydratase